MPTTTPQVAVVNESTRLNGTQAWNLAWALDYQVRWQFSPFWKSGADVALYAAHEVPVGAWVLALLDTSDQPGALGYHDEDGNEVPYGRVFCKTSEEDGCPASEVASHELLEMLVDPHVNSSAFDPASGRLYAMEVGDPVQGGAYDLGAPYGHKTGIVMSDFALPSWFDPNTPATQATSYRRTVKGAFALGSGGYVSYTKALPPNWEQEAGEHARQSTIDADDRVQRRLVR